MQTPVVLALDPEAVPLVRAGAARAGGDPTVIVAGDPDLATLLAAVHGVAAEYVVAVCSSPEAAATVAHVATPRRGRPLPILGIADGTVDAASRALLADPSLEGLNVAVPALEDTDRARLWDSLRADRIEERHHLVEVDGHPALVALHALATAPAHPDAGLSTGLDGVAALAAGAAGVLAGRMAARGRRWRTVGS
ncbi:MAG: hypothetical protein ACXWZD_08065 [Actinomycetota bacterium]